MCAQNVMTLINKYVSRKLQNLYGLKDAPIGRSRPLNLDENEWSVTIGGEEVCAVISNICIYVVLRGNGRKSKT